MSSLIGSILFVLSIIGKWKIFEDSGEEGWKSIIPFYSSYIFGRTFNEGELGKKLGWSEALLTLGMIPLSFIILFVLFFVFALTFSGGLGFITLDSLWVELYNTFSPSYRIGIAVLLIYILVTFIFVYVYHIKLHYRYTLYKNVGTWFMIIWLLIPSAGYLYFAFRNNQTDIYNNI